MTRTIVLIAALAFTALMGAMTLIVVARDGFTVLVAFSLLVLALFAFGIVGALRHPPDE